MRYNVFTIMPITPRQFSALLMLTLAVAVTGCGAQQPAYINIPGDRGDVASNDPNRRTALAVQAEAVRFSLNRRPVAGEVRLILPQGTSYASYQDVFAQLQARSTNSASGDDPDVEVASDTDAEQGGIRIPGVRLSDQTTLVPFFNLEREAAAGTVRVRAVRTRGMNGEVDLLRPGTGGRDQLETVYLEFAPFGRWMAQRSRTWPGSR